MKVVNTNNKIMKKPQIKMPKKHTCKSSKGKSEIVDVVKYLNKKTKSYCGYCGKELK